MKFTYENYIAQHNKVFNSIKEEDIKNSVEFVINAINNGSKIVTCGNGGSANTASHYIVDWNKMYTLSTGKPLRGISLTDNVGIITAYGNDLSYDDIFSGQIKSLMDEDDLLICVSGSGNSPNVIKAVETASSMGCSTLAIVGYDGGKLLPLADMAFHVPSFDMQICEDIHLSFGHMVMKMICEESIIE